MERQIFDGEYLRRLATGDAETERHFTAYFSEHLRIKLRSRLRSAELAEDIRQETFLRVLRGIRQSRSVEQPERLGAYVNAVCNNVMFESFRAQNRYQAVPEDFPEQADRAALASETLVTEERKRQVRAILDELPEKESRLLRALFLEERDKDDLCREFGVDREYLRVLVHRAKNRFRVVLTRRHGSAA